LFLKGEKKLLSVTSCDSGKGFDPLLTKEGVKEAQRMLHKLVNRSGNRDLSDIVIASGKGRRHLQTVKILFGRKPEITDRRLGIAETSYGDHLIISEGKKISLKKAVQLQSFRKFCEEIVPFLKFLLLKEMERKKTLVAVGTCMPVTAAGIPYKEVQSASIYELGMTDELKLWAKKVF